MLQKYQLSDGVKELFREANEEAYRLINQRNGTSISYFEELIPRVDPFLQRFEQEVGLNGTSVWKGRRLHECTEYVLPSEVRHTPLRALLGKHMNGLFYAVLDQGGDAAIIPLENYEVWQEKGKPHYHTYTMPHFIIIRPLHIDAKKHIIGLGLPGLEENARKLLNEMRAGSPGFDFKPIDRAFDYINEAYIGFADTLHSLATVCFEIEVHKSDPLLMGAFNSTIELPPAQVVADAWREAGAPFDYKPNRNERSERRRSFIEEYRQQIDLDQVHTECLQSARDYVASMKTVGRIYGSLSNSEMDAFQTALTDFMETQKPAGVLSPLDCIQRHIRKRKKK